MKINDEEELNCLEPFALWEFIVLLLSQVEKQLERVQAAVDIMKTQIYDEAKLVSRRYLSPMRIHFYFYNTLKVHSRNISLLTESFYTKTVNAFGRKE